MVLAPATDGHIGAWLLAAPLGAEVDLGSVAPRAGSGPGALAWPHFRLVSVADGALDLRRLVSARRDVSALLGAELVLGEALRGWLLVSADGAATVSVDGQVLFERDRARLRGASWDVLPLELAPGAHQLVLKLTSRREHWAVAVRVLDHTLEVPRGLSVRLPGTTARDAEALARSMATIEVRPNPASSGYAPTLDVSYRRGAPREPRLPVSVRVGAQPAQALGQVTIGPRGVEPFSARLDVAPAAKGTRALPVQVSLGRAHFSKSLLMSAELPTLLVRAAELRARLLAGPGSWLDRGAVLDPLEHAVLRAEEQAASGSRPAVVDEAVRALARQLDALEAGRDPLRQHGVVQLARRSASEDRPQGLLLHVPKSFEPGAAQRYPLVIALHGYNGSARGIMTAFLDSASRAPQVDGFVVAPEAHGNAFYRGPGERAVIDTLEWLLGTFPIDPDRVSITGVSMGGTGAAHIGLWYAERFAAAAPLCGYHSYFIRRDTRDKPLSAWEKARMAHWSPALLAENGRHLPLFVAQGTRDFPHENSKVLIRRYRELGHSLVEEWPETGHAVWEHTYDGKRLYPWLTRHVRPSDPARLTLKTDALRYGRQRWLTVTELTAPGQPAVVEAERLGPGALRLSASGAAAIRIDRSPGLGDGAVRLDLDGAALGFAPGEPIAVVRSGGTWRKGQRPPRGKRPGLEGPIRDVFLEPLVITWGSGDAATARANREVAEAFADRGAGVDVRYRVLPDTALTPALERAYAVVAVGTPRDHRLLQAVEDALPIGIEGAKLRVGARRLGGPASGATFILPNPRQPDRYLVVITGTDAAGIWRALSLPKLLPDFIAYDARLGPAASEQVLGDAEVLAAGFFDAAWQLPSSFSRPSPPAAASEPARKRIGPAPTPAGAGPRSSAAGARGSGRRTSASAP